MKQCELVFFSTKSFTYALFDAIGTALSGDFYEKCPDNAVVSVLHFDGAPEGYAPPNIGTVFNQIQVDFSRSEDRPGSDDVVMQSVYFAAQFSQPDDETDEFLILITFPKFNIQMEILCSTIGEGFRAIGKSTLPKDCDKETMDVARYYYELIHPIVGSFTEGSVCGHIDADGTYHSHTYRED